MKATTARRLNRIATLIERANAPGPIDFAAAEAATDKLLEMLWLSEHDPAELARRFPDDGDDAPVDPDSPLGRILALIEAGAEHDAEIQRALAAPIRTAPDGAAPIEAAPIVPAPEPEPEPAPADDDTADRLLALLTGAAEPAPIPAAPRGAYSISCIPERGKHG
jgi:hypothetical protein